MYICTMYIPKGLEDFDPSKLYEYDENKKTYILNIAVNSFKDLYNTWDYSPYRKRDINEALIKYIEECTSEIPIKHCVSLHLYLPEGRSDARKEKEGIIALRSYFKYLIHQKIQERKKHMKNARLYGLTGFLLLTLAYFIQKVNLENYYLPILPEGIYIGGWVLFWEVFSIVFFRTRELTKKIREYTRLSEAEITYHFGKTFPLSDII